MKFAIIIASFLLILNCFMIVLADCDFKSGSCCPTNLGPVTIAVNVTSIPANAFQYCATITTIIIPNTVTSLGTQVFYGCTSLATVTIGSGIAALQDYTFFGCAALTSITIPNTVTSLGQSVFVNSGLTSVIIPNSISTLGRNVFGGSALTSVTIGHNITTLPDSTFYGCSSLAHITIPDSVTSLGSEVFYGCTSLATVIIGSGISQLPDYTFHGCTSLKSITIPDTVTNLGPAVFAYSGLTSVTLSNYLAGQINELASNDFYGKFVATPLASAPFATCPYYSSTTLVTYTSAGSPPTITVTPVCPISAYPTHKPTPPSPFPYYLVTIATTTDAGPLTLIVYFTVTASVVTGVYTSLPDFNSQTNNRVLAPGAWGGNDNVFVNPAVYHGIGEGGISFVYSNGISYNLFVESGYYIESAAGSYYADTYVSHIPAPTYTITITAPTTAASPTTTPTTATTTTHVNSGTSTSTVTSTATSPLLGILAILILIPIIIGLGLFRWCLGQGRKAIDSAPSVENVITATTNIHTAGSPVQQSAEADDWSERSEAVKAV